MTIYITQSANTWVGGDTPYVQTSSSVKTGNLVGMNYGIGSFRGEEYIDTVTLIGDDGDILTAREQGVGVATQQTGFDGLDGVLGLGPTLGTDSSVKCVCFQERADQAPVLTTASVNLQATGRLLLA